MKQVLISVIGFFSIIQAQAAPVVTPDSNLNDSTRPEPWTIGIALSGGAALGMAHIGVLKVLEEEGIPISYVTGTSMGSIVGGMYAAGYTAAEMDSILTTVEWGTLFSERIPQRRMTLARREEGYRNIVEVTHRWFIPHIPSGVVSLQNVEILLTDLLAEREYDAGYNFDSLVIPFRCVAADVSTGDRKVFSEGSMVEAIRASIAIPAVFSPAEVERTYYIDGGAVQNLPVDPLLAFEPDFIIASDVIRWGPEARNIIDVVTRTMSIITEQNRREQRKLASVVIYPNVDEFMPSDFGRAKELVAAGEQTARLAMPAIKRRLGDVPLAYRRNPLYPRPKPLVKEVRFEGLKVTRIRSLQGLIKVREGDTLDFSDLVADLEALRQTGLFRHVSHELEFPGTNTVNVVYRVEEKDYGLYGLGVYYDNIYGFAVHLEVAQGNLFGSGARLSLTSTLGEPRDARIGLSGARLWRLPFTYRFEAYRNGTKHSQYHDGEWEFDYTTWTWGAETEFGYALGKWGYFMFGYAHRRHFHELPLVAEDTNRSEIVTGPTMRLRASTLDDLFFPNRGFDLALTSKFGLPTPELGEGFLKADLGTQAYFPFGDQIVLGTALGLGFGFDTLSRAELFRLGGTDLFGANEDQFAVPAYLTVRVTLGYKLTELLGNIRYPLRIEIITDIAALDCYEDENNQASSGETQFMGAGFGVSSNTPIGPIRAYIGLSSNRDLSFRISAGIPPRERM
ncbi:BamA/TamA family outer membrane protein [candidate division WOR-3 bacterium]|uniref:BamA/TamA family outer membrane protein n=1 Tax=candidate division WOR-3 bacterium TaxID=2052148 RepID=A0A9D5KBX6_UNCW3|nr:BamA/TamA family outer membrane protein [candidate division WOR-3 bacterium]MBD3365245.1 BamA/TamA family outer membrane protein [candidate division WOR-3 bacterium]